MKKNSILVGALIAGAAFTTGSLSASSNSDLSFNTLGSGSDVRSALMDNAGTGTHEMLFELKCGTEGTKAKEGESKSKDAKCGEGKCGEDAKSKASKEKDSTKKEAAAKETKSESKSKDAKCGEGKCGNE